MPPTPASPASSLRTSRILHAALVGSLVVYAAMVHLLQAIGWEPAADEQTLGIVRPVLYALGAAVAVAVLVLRSRWLSEDAAAALGRLGAPAALARLQTRLIVCLALAESLGIYALVLFLLGGRLGDFYGLWAPAVVLQLVLTPSRDVWEATGRGRLRGPAG